MSLHRRIIFCVAILLPVLNGCLKGPTPSAVITPETFIPDTALALPIAKPLIRWDFTSGHHLGWRPTNNLAAFSFDGEGLHTRSTGNDPYMVGPAIEIDAAEAWYVEVRMRSTKGSNGQLFWITHADSRYDEAKSQHFTVQSDGLWHAYRIPLHGNKQWLGTITQLRLDPTAAQDCEIAIASISILGPEPGALEAKSFGPAVAVAGAGEPFEVRAQLINAGDTDTGASSIRLVLPKVLTLVSGDAEVMLQSLAAGATQAVVWQVRGPAGLYDLALVAGGYELAQAKAVIADLDAKTVTLANDNLQIAYLRQPYGHGVAVFSARAGDGWRPLGRLNALASITYRAANGTDHQVLAYAERIERVPGGVRLPFAFTDSDGVRWRGESLCHLAPGDHWISITTTLQASEQVLLQNWMPLAFYAGDGTFGVDKESALFPGIEFLLDKEQSSGTDFFDPPHNVRYVPHPNKVTIPLMAVTQGGMSCGLMWNPLALWDGTHDRPGALFAAPNTWSGQNNHLMALVIPGPLFTGENCLMGSSPYELAVGRTLQLQARLFAVPAGDAISPLALWLKANGLPELPPLPRPYTQSISLCLEALTGPTWDEHALGWHFALADPWGPGRSAASELHLWLATLRSDLPADKRSSYRQLVRLLAEEYSCCAGPDGSLYLPELWMHLADQDRLPNIAQLAEARFTQNAEGYWPYKPGLTDKRPLGEEGDTSSGQIATNALYLLRLARITGDQELREGGLRALAYLEAHHSRRPEGAQVWELQLHCPDILAAAKAVKCYLEAYWLTGEARYAERAQWWALSGLPFVYLWAAQDRPIMAYTTIPVFAATWYTYPWLGRAVMWNGLDYALGLWHLNQALEAAGVERIVDWRQVAEGITRAATQMQPEEGPYVGMYPDAWDVVTGSEAFTWWLHPHYLLQNLYVMQGPGAEVQTVILRDVSPPVHLNAVAEILSAVWCDGRLEAELRYHVGETSVVMVNNVGPPPSQVWIDSKPLARMDSLKDGSSGWLYRNGALLIKIPFAGERARIAIDLRD